MKKIIITGATGLIGKKLCAALHKRGDEVYVFSRNLTKAKDAVPFAADYYEWNYKSPGSWQHLLENKDAVVHLAGANLSSKRWTNSFKKIILESREVSTGNIVDAFGRINNRPTVFICASAVGYYGSRSDELLTEESPPSDDFLSDVCVRWEKQASRAVNYGVRWVSVRAGVSLTPEDGALKKMLLPYRLFIGGPLGSGEQWFPWIHINDVIKIYLEAIDNKSLTGPVNAAAPGITRMNEFAAILGKVLKRPSLFRVPQFVLDIVVGEMGKVATSSQRVIPKKLKEIGYKFEFEEVQKALINLLG